MIWDEIGDRKVLAVVSHKVNKLYSPPFEHKFILKDGEAQKNFKNLERILDAASEAGLSRKDAIVAVGGGVVGDIAGFAAAVYMRGIDVIQVPTTLLACIDSSVGGKTAINTRHGKNLVGAFHQPKAVLVDTEFLKTLDERQFKTGLAEVVKYAFIERSIQDGDFAQYLNENADKILARDPETLQYVIDTCINLKSVVVAQDEKESGLRRILNFGHTYGHAVEKQTRYKYTHGEAVVAGMKYAFALALEKRLIDADYAQFADNLINKFSFREVPSLPQNKMQQHMLGDKKASNGVITFILPIGYAQVDAFEM
jgi:3-dehydroquinate synthase